MKIFEHCLFAFAIFLSISSGAMQGKIGVEDEKNSEVQGEVGVPRAHFVKMMEVPVHSGDQEYISFSPEGLTFAHTESNVIELRDAGTGQVLKTLKPNQGIVESLSFSPNGKVLASAGREGTIETWDVVSGQPIMTLEIPGKGIKDMVRFSPDGKILAGASRATGFIRLWDAETGAVLRDLPVGTGNRIIGFNFSPDGKMLAVKSNRSLIEMLDVEKGQQIWIEVDKLYPQWRTSYSPEWRTSFSPDGTMIASADHDKITLWEAISGKRIRTLRGLTATWVNFSPDGKMLMSEIDGGKIRLWDVASGEPVQTLDTQRDFVGSASFSADGKMIVSIHRGKLMIWAVADAQPQL